MSNATVQSIQPAGGVKLSILIESRINAIRTSCDATADLPIMDGAIVVIPEARYNRTQPRVTIRYDLLR